MQVKPVRSDVGLGVPDRTVGGLVEVRPQECQAGSEEQEPTTRRLLAQEVREVGGRVGDALGWGGGLEHAFSAAVTVWLRGPWWACPAALRLPLVCREDWSA